jgi:hypothetical protein
MSKPKPGTCLQALVVGGLNHQATGGEGGFRCGVFGRDPDRTSSPLKGPFCLPVWRNAFAGRRLTPRVKPEGGQSFTDWA